MKKKTVYYGRTDAAELLGITRQMVHKRQVGEEWEGCEIIDNGYYRIPSSAIAESRDRERRKLKERLAVLDDLDEMHELEDKLRLMKS